MEQLLFIPSPHWYRTSTMVASPDGWLLYGASNKGVSLCEPTPSESELLIKSEANYRLHIFTKVHADRVVCVDISPDWATQKLALTGGSDGYVKQLCFDNVDQSLKLRVVNAHDIHLKFKEDLIGVGYSTNQYAISLGSTGTLVKWELLSNLTKHYRNLIKGLKPTCMQCSPHMPLTVAVGTKQGIISVVNLTTNFGSITYKVRASDDDILAVSWCPQFEVLLQKDASYSLSARLQKIRELPDVVDQSNFETNQEKIKTNTNDGDIDDHAQLVLNNCAGNDSKTNQDISSGSESETDCERAVTPEDDIFDIYQEPDIEEFGHKKYQPELICAVKDKEIEDADFLAECQKLKQDIDRFKNEPEPTIEDLVESFENNTLHDSKVSEQSSVEEKNKETMNKPKGKLSDEDYLEDQNIEKIIESLDHLGSTQTKGKNKSMKKKNTSTEEIKTVPGNVVHTIQKHLLATIAIHGKVSIWNKSGKQVATTSVFNTTKNSKGVPMKAIGGSVFWYSADKLLIGDTKASLLMCNPLVLDSKNKLYWNTIHSIHKRGLYSITSPVPRLQDKDTILDDYPVWTFAQDKVLVQYSLKQNKPSVIFSTNAGFTYHIATCPYDCNSVAAAVGDGCVKVWRMQEDDDELRFGSVVSYWNNVQGKVLVVAWHPTKENLLAFGTAEGRVGLIHTSGAKENPARPLIPVVGKGVYSMEWADQNKLLVCGNGNIYIYNTDRIDDEPETVEVVLEGKQWKVTELKWSERALTVGTYDGEVGLVTPRAPYVLAAAAVPFTKIVQSICWHPSAVTISDEESPYKNWIAVASTEKHVIILEVSEKDDGSIKLSELKSLHGHIENVVRVAWSPHRNGQLLSTSTDWTVRVWDAVEGVCTATYTGHRGQCLTAAWFTHPDRADWAMSGGTDNTLRVWNVTRCTDGEATASTKRRKHGAKFYRSVKLASLAPHDQSDEVKDEDDEVNDLDEAQKAVDTEGKYRSYQRMFLLPKTTKQLKDNTIGCCRKLFELHVRRSKQQQNEGSEDLDSISNETGTGTQIVLKENSTHDRNASNKENIADAENNDPDVKTTNSVNTCNIENIVKIENQSLQNGIKQTAELLENGEAENIHDKNGHKYLDDNSSVNERHQHSNCENGGMKKKKKKSRKNSQNKEFDTNLVELLYGTVDDLRKLLEFEQESHLSFERYENWIVLSILKGDIDKAFKFAASKDILSPFLVSIAPSVSLRFWKEAMTSYMAQGDRSMVKQREHTFNEHSYGGNIIRKMITLLSMQDVLGAVSVLAEAKLFKEAYILARLRYMDQVATDVLKRWEHMCNLNSVKELCALVNIMLGNISNAAIALHRNRKAEHSLLAAELARFTGQESFAESVKEKGLAQDSLLAQKDLATRQEEILKDLPQKLELYLRMKDEAKKNEGLQDVSAETV